MSAATSNAFVMALHAVEALTSFGEDELDDAFLLLDIKEDVELGSQALDAKEVLG